MPLTTGDLAEIKAIVQTSFIEFKIELTKLISDTVQEKLAPFRTELTELKTTVSTQQGLINDLTSKLETQTTLITDQKTLLDAHAVEHKTHTERHVHEKIRLLDLEIHHRKYNMLVTNIEETEGESNANLVTKFKKVLTDVVKLPSQQVNDMKFRAAHRLGGKKGNTARMSIFFFDKLDDITDCWTKIRRLGKVKHNFKTHLPIELSQYRSKLLLERDSAKKSRGAVMRVGEDRGYPYLDEKIDGRWVGIKHYKNMFGDFLPKSEW